MKVKLKDICNIQSGGTPSRSHIEYWNNGTIPWVKISDFNGKYLEKTSEFITELGLNYSSAKIFPKGTLLYTIFATLGETCFLNIDAATNQAIAGLQIIDSMVFPDYLYYYLISIKHRINSIGRGVAQNNINLKILKEMIVPIPLIAEQQKIAAVLDKVSELIALRKKQLEKLDELVKSRFVEMFESLSDKNYVVVSDICKIITDGTHQSPKFVESGIPFLLVSNIANNAITYDTKKFITEETYSELIKRTPVEIGDILLSTVGSYGHPAVVKSNKRFCFQRHIAYLKPKTELVNSDYLHEAFLSSDVQRQIQECVKGIAQKTLNLSEIRKIYLPLPPLNLQEQFSNFVTKVDKQKLTIQQSLNKLEVLKKALMQQYFG